MKTRTQPIAAEGWLIIAALFIAAALFFAADLDIAASVFFAAALPTIWFFRNPERIPDERDALVFISPIDGVIESIENQGGKTVIAVKNRLFDAHVLRSPAQSAAQIQITRGIAAKLPNRLKALRQREIISQSESEITLFPETLESRLYPPKSACYLGERIGFFYGGTALISIADRAELKVAVGDKIRASETLIGALRS